MLAAACLCILAFQPQDDRWQTLVGGRSTTDLYPSAGRAPESLAVLDLREQPDFGERFLAASAQGLINSGLPRSERAYLILKDQDDEWLGWLLKRRYIRGVRRLKSLDSLLDLLPVRDALIYEDNPSHAANIATTLAGCRRLLVASNPALVEKYRLRIREDLRGRWKSNVEAYRWLLKRHERRISDGIVAITVPFRTPTHTPTQLRDYLIANRIFTFWLSGKEDSKLPGSDRAAEEALLRKTLSTTFLPNVPCLGYPWSGDEYGPGEWDGVSFLSQVGKFLVPTDNFANLSVWSKFPISVKTLAKEKLRIPRLEVGKRYAALVMSDGDNLCTWYDFFPRYWTDLKDRSFPVGWTVGPTLPELAPPIYEYLVEHLPPGHSVGAGVSGIGYIASEEYGKEYGLNRDQIVSQFMRMTGEACIRSGIDWLWVMRYGGPGSEWLDRYAREVVGIRAIMGGYAQATNDLTKATESRRGVGVFHCVLDAGDPAALRRELDRVLADPACPRFLHLFILNWNFKPHDLAQAAAYARERGLTLVTPEALGTLHSLATER